MLVTCGHLCNLVWAAFSSIEILRKRRKDKAEGLTEGFFCVVCPDKLQVKKILPT